MERDEGRGICSGSVRCDVDAEADAEVDGDADMEVSVDEEEVGAREGRNVDDRRVVGLDAWGVEGDEETGVEGDSFSLTLGIAFLASGAAGGTDCAGASRTSGSPVCGPLRLRMDEKCSQS